MTQAMAAERLRAIVRGRVQAVGFRAYVYERARFRSLRGWVRNRPDGTVECVAEGPRAALDALLEELRNGPPSARIKQVDAEFEPARGDLDTFDVRF